jgi:hypothetical protein
MATAKPRPTMTIGTTGLRESAGMIDEEFLLRLRGQNGARLYKEMWFNSPIIGSALNVIETLITQTEWRVEPADVPLEQKAAAEAEAEDTEASLGDMSHTFEELLSEVLSMLVFGWAYFEMTYKIRRGATNDGKTRSKFDDGLWGWRKIEIRGQETLDRWVFDDDGGLSGMWQADYYSVAAARASQVLIPIEKALLFRTKTHKGNPEGLPLLRHAVIPYWYVKRIEKFEAIGIERELAGMPIFEVPPDLLIANPSTSDAALKTQLENFITSVRLDERYGGLIPSEVNADGTSSQFKFKLMSSGGARRVDTDPVIKRHESRMLMVFLAQFLLLGMDKVGTQALGSTFTDLFGTALGATMDKIASVFNRFAIRRRQAMNGKPQELDPKLVHGDVAGPDLEKLGKYLLALAGVGLDLSGDAVQRKLFEIGGLPLADEHMPDDEPESTPEAPQEEDESMETEAKPSDQPHARPRRNCATPTRSLRTTRPASPAPSRASPATCSRPRRSRASSAPYGPTAPRRRSRRCRPSRPRRRCGLRSKAPMSRLSRRPARRRPTGTGGRSGSRSSRSASRRSSAAACRSTGSV